MLGLVHHISRVPDSVKSIRPHPHPALKPDAIIILVGFAQTSILFQSSSSPKTGCNDGYSIAVGQSPSSNPHPARRLDAIGDSIA